MPKKEEHPMILTSKFAKYAAEEEPAPRTSAHCVLQTPARNGSAVGESWIEAEHESSMISQLSHINEKRVYQFAMSKDSKCSFDDIGVILNQLINKSNYSSNGSGVAQQSTPWQKIDHFSGAQKGSFKKLLKHEASLTNTPKNNKYQDDVTLRSTLAPKPDHMQLPQQEQLEDDSMVSFEDYPRPHDVENFSPTFGKLPELPSRPFEIMHLVVPEEAENAEQPSTSETSPTDFCEQQAKSKIEQIPLITSKEMEPLLTKTISLPAVESNRRTSQANLQRLFMNLEALKKKSSASNTTPSKQRVKSSALKERSTSHNFWERINLEQQNTGSVRSKAENIKKLGRITSITSLKSKHAEARNSIEGDAHALNIQQTNLTQTVTELKTPSSNTISFQLRRTFSAKKSCSQVSGNTVASKAPGLVRSRTGMLDGYRLLKTERNATPSTERFIKHTSKVSASATKLVDVSKTKRIVEMCQGDTSRSCSRTKAQDLIQRVRQPVLHSASRSPSGTKTAVSRNVSAVKKTNKLDMKEAKDNRQPTLTSTTIGSRHLLPSSLRGMTARFSKQKQSVFTEARVG